MAETPVRRGLLPAGAVVLVVAVIAAAGNHRWHNLALTRDSPRGIQVAPPRVTLATATNRAIPKLKPIVFPHWIPVVLTCLLIAVGLLIVVAIARALWPLLQRLLEMLRRRRPPAAPPAGVVALDLGGFADSLREQVREAELGLGAPARTSSDAVIACWLRLEDAAAGSGTVREAWQTPSEFTSQLLVSRNADPAACDQLLRLYQRARFGHEQLGPDDTAAAATALRRIAATLGSGARPPGTGDPGSASTPGSPGPSADDTADHSHAEPSIPG